MTAVREAGRDFPSEPDASASSGRARGDGAENQPARPETQRLATKEDIQKIKVWVLGGVIGGIVFSVTVAILKLLG